MTTDAAAPVAPPETGPRPVTLEDVHRLVGALCVELDMLRRDNARLRERLERHG